jgi:hypothetical protein
MKGPAGKDIAENSRDRDQIYPALLGVFHEFVVAALPPARKVR